MATTTPTTLSFYIDDTSASTTEGIKTELFSRILAEQRRAQEQSIWQAILGDRYYTTPEPVEKKKKEKPYEEVDSFVELW